VEAVRQVDLVDPTGADALLYLLDAGDEGVDRVVAHKVDGRRRRVGDGLGLQAITRASGGRRLAETAVLPEVA